MLGDIERQMGDWDEWGLINFIKNHIWLESFIPGVPASDSRVSTLSWREATPFIKSVLGDY